MVNFQDALFQHLVKTGEKFNSCHDELGQFCSTGGGEEVNVHFPSVAKKAYNFKDYESGLLAKMSKLENVGNADVLYNVKGYIFKEDGKTVVGMFERDFVESEVYHTSFKLAESLQNQGFGTKFYKHSEDQYVENGIKRINLDANMEVGGYAWARMGFDFKDEDERTKFINSFVSKYEDTYKVKPNLVRNTAYEIASTIGPDGSPIGKNFMLGSSWSATKNLDPNSMDYQIGKQYYETKGL